jgi:hypothetical protein
VVTWVDGSPKTHPSAREGGSWESLPCEGGCRGGGSLVNTLWRWGCPLQPSCRGDVRIGKGKVKELFDITNAIKTQVWPCEKVEIVVVVEVEEAEGEDNKVGGELKV